MTCATVAGLTSWCGRRQRISTGGRWSRRVPARIRVLSYCWRREDRGLPLDPNRASSYCWRHGSCGGRNIARHCRHLLPRPNHWRHRRPRADTAGHGEIPAALPDTSVANRIGRKGVVNLAEWDVAYILGALTSEERLAFERYLASQPDRAAQLTEFEAKISSHKPATGGAGQNFVPSREKRWT